MKIRILYGYRGARTNEHFLAPGIHEVDDSFGEYLIQNGHAAITEPPAVVKQEKPIAPKEEPEIMESVKPQRRGRKQTKEVFNGSDS